MQRLVRTFHARRRRGALYVNFVEPDVPFAEVGTPTWDGLPLDRYLSLLDMLNPMHRLWSDGRWNKLTVAHGCYWKKCSFCDVSLDYISRYETATAEELADRIEARSSPRPGRPASTSSTRPRRPRRSRPWPPSCSARQRDRSVGGATSASRRPSPPSCAEQLADSGCIAISGGLEVASDRLLALMKKGVSVDQVARVTKGFADAGILVHAYLMYGFPTQTVQDTVDALELRAPAVRGNGCIQSGFWHRFTCTRAFAGGAEPGRRTIGVQPAAAARRADFAKNDVGFIDPTGVRPRRAGRGLEEGDLQLHARHRPR